MSGRRGMELLEVFLGLNMRCGWKVLAVSMGAGLALWGCAGSKKRPEPQVARGTVPLGLQMVRSEAQMRKYPFRTLLDFEIPTDTVFVKVDGGEGKIDAARSHTGGNALALAEGVKSLSVRMSSLTSGTTFPGRWTLIGAYFHALSPQRMTATYEVEDGPSTTVNVLIPANQWTPVLLDLSQVVDAAPQNRKVGSLRFSFPEGLAQAICCDNVVVVDNTQLLVDGGATSYSVKERGFTYLIERPNQFRIALKTPEAAQSGWVVEEATPVRARFVSPGGSEKAWVLYSDGRVFKDGQYDVLGTDQRTKETLSMQHRQPAQLSIMNDLGRVHRTSAGDADNDGYCEAVGSYQIAATGPRVEVIVTPRTPVLVRPVLEIMGLPAGKALVTMDGRLVENVVRLEDGRVLVELPGRIGGATRVNVRVQ